MKIAKLISSIALAAMLAGCCSMCCDCACSTAEQPNISVFAHFIRNTAKSLGADNIFAVKANVFLYLKSCPKSFDIVFSDAPYDLEGLDQVVDLVLNEKILKEDGIFIFEHSDKYNFENHPLFWQSRSYGSVQFSFFKK